MIIIDHYWDCYYDDVVFHDYDNMFNADLSYALLMVRMPPVAWSNRLDPVRSNKYDQPKCVRMPTCVCVCAYMVQMCWISPEYISISIPF